MIKTVLCRSLLAVLLMLGHGVATYAWADAEKLWDFNKDALPSGLSFPPGQPPVFGPGAIGRGLHFDGKRFLTLNQGVFEPKDAFTIMAWVRLQQHAKTGQTPLLVDRDATHTDVQLVVLPDDFAQPHRLMLTIANEKGEMQSIVSVQPIPTGRWVHVAAIYDGRTMSLMVDGEPSGSKPFTGSISSRSRTAMLGGDTFGNRLVGELDEVLLASRPLSPDAVSQKFKKDLPQVRQGTLIIKTKTPTGQPLPLLGGLLVTTLDGDPVTSFSGGKTEIMLSNLPPQPLSLNLALEVPEFGLLRFTADRGGRGIQVGASLEIISEVALSRMEVIRAMVKELRREGFAIPAATTERIQKAEILLQEALLLPTDSVEKPTLAMLSLKHSVPAGEELIKSRGMGRLKKDPGAKKKLLSTLAMYAIQEGEPMRRAIEPVFNTGVLVWHWALNSPKQDTFLWSLAGNDQEEAVRWLASKGKKIRGHALVWLSPLPNWIMEKYPHDAYPDSYKAAREKVLRFTEAVVRHFPKVAYWNIANEANNSWSNLGGVLTPDEMIALIRDTSLLTGKLNPQAKRGINVVPEDEDAFEHLGKKPLVMAPRPFLRKVIKEGVEFDYTGLQLYFSGRDLLETDQLVKRYAALGKRIHITESETASSQLPQKGNRSFANGVHPAQVFKWKRSWDEALQAEWLEGMFLLAVGNEQVDEWNWWDVADYGDVYYPWGGLMDDHYRPKAAYRTLETLVRNLSSKSLR